MWAVFCDLDGTLLQRHKDGSATISTKDLLAIRRAMQAGILFIPASGRHDNEIQSIFADAGFLGPLPAIFSNGTGVRDLNGKLHIQAIAHDQLRSILDYLHPFHLRQLIIDEDGQKYLNENAGEKLAIERQRIEEQRKNFGSESYARLQKHFMSAEKIIEDAASRPTIEELYLPKRMDPTDLVLMLQFFTPDTKLRGRLQQKIQEMGLAATVGHYGVEIGPSGVSKASGVLKMCELHQIPLDRTVAIGDNLNDLEMMLEVAAHGGRAYLVKNATPALKKKLQENLTPDIYQKQVRLLNFSNTENAVSVVMDELYKQTILNQAHTTSNPSFQTRLLKKPENESQMPDSVWKKSP